MTEQFLVHQPISKAKSSSLQVQGKGHHESGRKLLHYQHCSKRINSEGGVDGTVGCHPPATGSGPLVITLIKVVISSQTSHTQARNIKDIN